MTMKLFVKQYVLQLAVHFHNDDHCALVQVDRSLGPVIDQQETRAKAKK